MMKRNININIHINHHRSVSRATFLIFILMFFLTMFHSSTAAKVVHKKEKRTSTSTDDIDDDEVSKRGEAGAALVDFNDPDLLDAMQIFANMSPEEMMETMEELKVMLGDDPETMAAVQEVMEQIPKIKATAGTTTEADLKDDDNDDDDSTESQRLVHHIQTSLKDMIAQDEVAVATQDALKLLKESSSSSWDVIWKNRHEILEAVLASGKIAPEDAARFRTSSEEWETELKFIWNELQTLAAANAKDEL